MTIILFVIIFGIIVLSHEFGHFIVGRKNGIHVVEFAVGMGPTLFHIHRGGTKYSIKLFPFGGACMFEGEEGGDLLESEAEQPSDERQGGVCREIRTDREKILPGQRDVGGSFLKASVWSRIATIFAGPFVNLLLGFLLDIEME